MLFRSENIARVIYASSAAIHEYVSGFRLEHDERDAIEMYFESSVQPSDLQEIQVKLKPMMERFDLPAIISDVMSGKSQKPNLKLVKNNN